MCISLINACFNERECQVSSIFQGIFEFLEVAVEALYKERQLPLPIDVVSALESLEALVRVGRFVPTRSVCRKETMFCGAPKNVFHWAANHQCHTLAVQRLSINILIRFQFLQRR